MATFVGCLAPWALSHRDSYVYHFLPSYTALIILLGGYLGWARGRRPPLVLWFLAVVLVVAALYAPVWSMGPITLDAFRARLFLERWR
jgi:dolichyl-phosphate-mannose--protein O-mannosyl transferase